MRRLPGWPLQVQYVPCILSVRGLSSFVLLLYLCIHFFIHPTRWLIYALHHYTCTWLLFAGVTKLQSTWTEMDTGCTVQGFSRIFATLIDTLLWIATSCWGIMVHRWSANLREAGTLCPLLQQPQDMRCWSDFYNQFTRAGGINPVHSLILPLPPPRTPFSLSLTLSPTLPPLPSAPCL